MFGLPYNAHHQKFTFLTERQFCLGISLAYNELHYHDCFTLLLRVGETPQTFERLRYKAKYCAKLVTCFQSPFIYAKVVRFLKS